MASQILTEFKQKIDALELIPGGGGCFEIEQDGELIYSKLETGEFPDEASIVESVGTRLKNK